MQMLSRKEADEKTPGVPRLLPSAEEKKKKSGGKRKDERSRRLLILSLPLVCGCSLRRVHRAASRPLSCLCHSLDRLPLARPLAVTACFPKPSTQFTTFPDVTVAIKPFCHVLRSSNGWSAPATGPPSPGMELQDKGPLLPALPARSTSLPLC